jgi:multidrug resistance efflux pump
MTRMTAGSPKSTPVDDRQPIPIPMRVRWQRFRHQLLPVLTLVFCSILAGWLWYHQAAGGHAIGAVEVLHVPVNATVHGTLAYLPGKQLQVLDKVGEGDVIALIDAGPFKTRRDALQAELEDLRRQAKEAPGGDRAKSLQAMIDAKQQDLADADVKLESLQIRSPISGTVTHVHLRPGQAVQAGNPILEISADRSVAIVAYLRQDQQLINPTKGMPVQVYLNRRPVQTVVGQVETVGGQVESVPNRQLRDQKVPEWGLPVRVAVPDGVALRPGEIVTLDFRVSGASR